MSVKSRCVQPAKVPCPSVLEAVAAAWGTHPMRPVHLDRGYVVAAAVAFAACGPRPGERVEMLGPDERRFKVDQMTADWRREVKSEVSKYGLLLGTL